VIPQRFFRELTFLLPICLIHSGCSRRNEPGPLAPQQLESFQINADFRVELYAEPHVIDPVEIVFDEDGRAFVAELRDYPNDQSSAGFCWSSR
jgi:hypothetical protein